MIPVYIKKAWQDLARHKSRTFVIILSITFCLSMVGTLLNTKLLFEQAQNESMKSTNAADATFTTSTFNKDISFLKKVKGVQSAERKWVTRARAEIGRSNKNFELTALPENGAFSINKIRFPGNIPSNQKGIYLDQSTMDALHLKKGSAITLSLPGKSKKTLKVAGAVKDYYKTPITYSGKGYGYLTEKSFRDLGAEKGYNTVQLTFKSGTPENQTQKITADAASALKAHDVSVSRTEQAEEPFFLRKTMADSILLLLILLGGLSLILGILLVVHLFYRMVAEQAFEMSVMKVLGAGTRHFWMQYGAVLGYIGTMVFLFSTIISSSASWFFSKELVQRLNMGEPHFSYSKYVLLAALVLSFLVPALAAVFPIARIVRIKAADGLQQMRQQKVKRTEKRNFGRFFTYRVLSVRNAFSKKLQLLTNIVMLSFGGAVIIACMALNSSLLSTLKGIQHYWNYDVEWDVQTPLSTDQLIKKAENVQHVKNAEAWTTRNTELQQQGASDKHNALLVALPAKTEMVRPKMEKGNWLKKQDTIVVNRDVEQLIGNVNPGDKLKLKIGDKTKVWRISGIMSGQLNGPAIYMERDQYASWMKNNSSNRVVAKISSPAADHSYQTISDADKVFAKNMIAVQSVQTASDMTDRPLEIIQLIYYAIMAVGVLFAAVGAFNLMTAMSVNVLERKKEIGVIRSMGGTKRKIYSLFIGEGILIASISWAISAALAYPLHLFLSQKVGESLLHDSLQNVFPISGIVFWLAASIIIGVFASMLPAGKAANQPLRELL